jgi:hypothetical protein
MAEGWRAALLIDNLALGGRVAASSQAQNMPASNLLTPHTTERWRATVSAAFFVVDLGASFVANTLMVKGLTCGPGASVRCRLSNVDSTGASGDAFDSQEVANGEPSLDVDYGAAVWALPTPRYGTLRTIRYLGPRGVICRSRRSHYRTARSLRL